MSAKNITISFLVIYKPEEKFVFHFY